MSKDEFSVNELEPERNNNVGEEETVQEDKKTVSDAALLNRESKNLEAKEMAEKVQQQEDVVEEYQGPTIKEVIANSVNPDYQGPTAKEIVVNSVKIDNTKKKNMSGLFVLILVLLLVGTIVIFEVFSDDGNKKNVDYLKGLPEWVESYNVYFKEEYENIVAYNVAFLDLDFDGKPEAIVNYVDDKKTVYEIVDAIDKQYIKVGEISNILMMYSFTDRDVRWYVNIYSNDTNMNLIDLGKRLKNETDYEINLSVDDLSQFKSDHFNLSYQIKYTKIGFRTHEQNLAEAVKLYEEERTNVVNIVTNVVDKYSDEV